jgi:hypothetical protein
MEASGSVFHKRVEPIIKRIRPIVKFKWPITISGLFLFIQQLAPANLRKINIDYFTFFIRSNWPEIVLIVLCLVAIIYYSEIELGIIKLADLFKRKRFITKLLFSIYLFVAIPLFGYSFYFLLRQRIQHYIKLNSSYRYYLHENICEEINLGNYDKAAKLCQRVKDEYPDDENKIVNRLLPLLNGRSLYAKMFFSDSDNYMDYQGKFTRKKFFNVLTAYALMPDKSHSLVLTSMYNYLLSLSNIPSEFYKLVKSGSARDSEVMFEQYSWILFEEEMVKLLTDTNGKLNISKAKIVFGKITLADFELYYQENWMIKKASKVLKTKNEVKIGPYPKSLIFSYRELTKESDISYFNELLNNYWFQPY